MRFEDDSERRLHEKVGSLTPRDAVVARMQVRVLEGYEARPRSLWREWLGLLESRPLKHGALVAMAAALVLFSSPLAAVLRALATSASTQVAQQAAHVIELARR